MRQTYLPFNLPELGEDEVQAVVETLRSRWITRGPATQRFERALAEYLGVPHVVALSSCTAGMQLALMALGIGPGDEVITTPYTFAASINVILHVGATPVLVDVDPTTANLDPGRVEEAITDRTRAILPVHFAGHPVDLGAFDRIRDHYGLPIVEDAAHAIGARYEGRNVGTFGNLTALSFYATKNLTTGEGGALVVPDGEMADKIRAWSLHGMSRNAWNRYSEKGSWQYDVVAPGFKYNMTDIQAALGIVQLEKFDRMQERRHHIAQAFSEALQGLPVELPVVKEGVTHAWHLYPLRLMLDRIQGTRAEVIEDLKQQQIGTSVHFIPIPFHSYYQDRFGWQPGLFPHAERYFEAEVSLPLYPSMTDQDVADVIDAVHYVLRMREI